MKTLRSILLILFFTTGLTKGAAAWDLEIGVRALIPRVGTGVQEYTDEVDKKVDIKPKVETTATGQSYHLGLRIDSWQIDYDNSKFNFDSTIQAGEVVMADTEIECTITESRLGVNYHIERELAGIFGGIGVSRVKEELKSTENIWIFETTTPYLKAGLDLIINSFTLRYEQVFYSLGEHNIQVNSLGLILVF